MNSIKNIFTNGVLVDVNISCWTGEKQLTVEDMGLTSEKVSKAFKLGRKALIPPEVLLEFKHLDYEARNLLMKKSLDFPFGCARFIPKKIFVNFVEEMDKIKIKFYKKVDELVENYDKYRIQMREYFLMAAKTAYVRLQALTLAEKNESKKNAKVDVYAMTEHEYINWFLERISKVYPSLTDIRGKYSIDFVVYQMELPDLSEASIDDVGEEATKIRLIENAYQMKIRKAMEEYAGKIVTENRDRISINLNNLIELLGKEGRFTEKSYTSIQSAIKNFKDLNVAQDHNLEKALDDFDAKCLTGYSAKAIRENEIFQKTMLEELLKLRDIITNKLEINALTTAYREQIKI